MQTIKDSSNVLSRFGTTALITAVSLRTLISFASWFRFTQAATLGSLTISQSLNAAASAMLHSNAFFNLGHFLWLLNHASFAIAMHYATAFMGIAAMILLAATILQLAIFSVGSVKA